AHRTSMSVASATTRRRTVLLATRPSLRRRLVEGSLDRVIGIGRNRLIAPQPSQHVRQNGAALFLTVLADAPGVIDVVALVGERVHQRDILQEPVAPLVVLPIAFAVVVASILQVDANRLFLALPHEIGVLIAAAQVHKAADDAEDFAKVVRPL